MKTLLAVDGNSILNRAFWGIRPLTTKTGLFTNAVYGFATILKRHIEEWQPDAVAAAFDLKAPTFRHKMFDGYKAGRRGMPDELAMQLPYARKFAEAMGISVLTLEGFEADDILGTLARLCRESGEWQCLILTGDRDSLQLISPSVKVLLAGNTETAVWDGPHFSEHYGVPAASFVDVKALMGDSSDNIPGVPGIGEKTALSLIAKFGSLDGVYAAYDEAASDDPKASAKKMGVAPGVYTKLGAGRDSALLSRRLAAIDCAAPIGILPDELLTSGPDRTALRSLFTELEFGALTKRFGLDEDTPPADAGGEASGPVLLPTDAILSRLGERFAVMEDEEGRLTFSSGEEILIPSDGDGAALLGCGRSVCVFDAKAMLKKWGPFDFAFDAMLAAYVDDPSDGALTFEKIRLKYLSESCGKPDARSLFRLWKTLEVRVREGGMERLLYEIEQPLVPVLAAMEDEGFRIDTEGLAAFAEELGARADEIAERIYFAAGCEFNLNSPKQLSEILFDRLGLPAGKKTHSGSYSTNAEILEKLAPYYPIVADILEYRQVTKLRSTYGEGLLAAADAGGRIHSTFHQALTATGRLSSSEPNLQNIPVRTELGRQMRRFFIPSGDGRRVLIDADYSQIELRLLAHIAGDENMIETFQSGADIHAMTASKAFGVPMEAVTSELRKRAKAVNFGIVYGISDFSLAQDLHITKKQAGEYIEAYLATYPKVAAYLKDIVKEAEAAGFTVTMFGRRRYIPELTSQKKLLRAFGERVAMNSPIQGSAADIIKIAMIAVDRALKKSGLDARLILQVHDELIVDAAEKDADAAAEILVREMEAAADIRAGLEVSCCKGKTWFECKD